MHFEMNFSGVDTMSRRALESILVTGIQMPSRVGPVRRSQGPVNFVTDDSTVPIFSACPVRDANPFFHLREAYWILDGEGDVSILERFNARYREYAQPQGHVWGAYGHRLRKEFGFDQIERALELLSFDRYSRQAVLQMWTSDMDLCVKKFEIKDRPCNTQIYLGVVPREGVDQLDLMVTQRSGDLFWGTLGANHVCFRVMHHYLADRLGVKVGRYDHTVFNLHVYESVLGKYADVGRYTDSHDSVVNMGEFPSKEVLEEIYFTHTAEKTPTATLRALQILKDKCGGQVHQDFTRAARLWLERRLENRSRITGE